MMRSNWLSRFIFSFRYKVYGDARWMTFLGKRYYFNRRNKGLVLSNRYRMSLKDSYTNLCLVAPTGSGKTTRFCVINILKSSGSLVCTDPSGELFRLTSGHMKDRGYKIQVLQPSDLSHSLRFNPMEYYRTPQEIRQLATILGFNGAGDKTDPFWRITAINIIYICLSALAGMKDDKYKNLGNLRWLLNHLGGVEDGVNDYMAKYLDDATFAEYKAFLAQDSKVIASILSSARACLDLWSDPDVVKLSATNSIDISALHDQKTIIYIIIPEHEIVYFSLLANLFYSACFKYCLQHSEGNPVFFMMDEFGNMGNINRFSSISTTLRKRNCSISIILQDLSQLEAIYGKEGLVIYSGGMNNKLFFSGLDLKACSYLEQVLGSSTEFEKEEDSRLVRKPLLTVDQIRRLKKTKAVLISGRYRPVKFRMKPFYRIPYLNHLTKKKPAAIEVDYSNEKVEFIKFQPSKTTLEVARLAEFMKVSNKAPIS